MNPARLTGPPMRLRLGGAVLPMVGRVRMYVCGITPYDVTHLGHASTYIWADAAERVLKWHGHTVTVARNVTDVDDVLFAEARRRGESHTMLATLQRAAFEGTMATLQVRPPDLAPTAAQHIGHVIQLANALLERDAAYERGGTVYARTEGAAARAGFDRETALARAEEFHDNPGDPDKDDPLDVTVWQASAEDDEVSWPSPWGEGRPGWHAECAAMVLALYGPSVDIHCGGGDLVYPHHACEAALAEARDRRDAVRPRLAAGRHRLGGRREDGEVHRQPRPRPGPVARALPRRGPAAVPQPAVGAAVGVQPGAARRGGGDARAPLRRGRHARAWPPASPRCRPRCSTTWTCRAPSRSPSRTAGRRPARSSRSSR